MNLCDLEMNSSFFCEINHEIFQINFHFCQNNCSAIVNSVFFDCFFNSFFINMSSKHSNIPIFLPELACPHRCVFCNQSLISGQNIIPSYDEVIQIIERNIQTIPKGNTIQIAFFGGSFTGIDPKIQEEYLQLVQPYLASGVVSSIRISTRPDYIDETILDMLIAYGVCDIELGAQSIDEDVLHASGRGHTVDAVYRASKLILSKKLRLGLQMMIGLPGDSFEKSLHTAKTIITLGAHSTRIYPTLVIKDTPLALQYERGSYSPLSLDEAIDWTKALYLLFEKHHVTVLRTGLHPNDDFNAHKNLLAGPYHPSFKELVLSRIWFDIFEKSLPKEKGKLHVYVSEEQINHAVGYNSTNKNMLKETYGWIKFQIDTSLQNYEFRYSYN